MSARLTLLQHVTPDVPRLHMQDSGASVIGRRAELVIFTTDDRLDIVTGQIAATFNARAATATALDEIVDASTNDVLVLSSEELRKRLAEIRQTAREALDILGVLGRQA